MTKAKLTQIQEGLDTMTITELTTHYNTLTGKDLKKFSTKAEGIKRLGSVIEKLIEEFPKGKENRAVSKKPRTQSISFICRQLILAGIPEAEAKRQMVEVHGIPADKAGYYNWNVNAMKRAGTLPTTTQAAA